MRERKQRKHVWIKGKKKQEGKKVNGKIKERKERKLGEEGKKDKLKDPTVKKLRKGMAKCE